MRVAMVVGLSAAAAGAAACTHERPLGELDRVAGRRVLIETYGQRQLQAVAIRGSDHVTFEDGVTFATDHAGVFASTEVTTVTEVRRGQGALEGAGIGFVIGAATGAVIGYADGDDTCPPSPGFCLKLFTAGEKALLAGAVIGGTGAVLGAIVGAVSGSRYVYSYGDRVRITPIGPPGSLGGASLKF